MVKASGRLIVSCLPITSKKLEHNSLTMDTNTISKDAMIDDMLHAIITIYANAAESPEWIRMRLAPIIQQAIHNQSVADGNKLASS
jgi:hypothetical protein